MTQKKFFCLKFSKKFTISNKGYLKKYFFHFLVLIFKIRVQFNKVQNDSKKFFDPKIFKKCNIVYVVLKNAEEGCISIPSVHCVSPE